LYRKKEAIDFIFVLLNQKQKIKLMKLDFYINYKAIAGKPSGFMNCTLVARLP
jgi:hypothetical protein